VPVRQYNGLKAHETHMPFHDKRQVDRAADRLAQLYTALNNPAEAQKWREAATHL
jgi:hypothetical protein